MTQQTGRFGADTARVMQRVLSGLVVRRLQRLRCFAFRCTAREIVQRRALPAFGGIIDANAHAYAADLHAVTHRHRFGDARGLVVAEVDRPDGAAGRHLRHQRFAQRASEIRSRRFGTLDGLRCTASPVGCDVWADTD